MMEAYIIDGIRTPIGSYQGGLSSVRVDDLAAHVIKQISTRNSQIPPDAYDDVLMGCANQAGEDNRNIARMALLLAGLPYSVPGETINRLCASGLASVVNASHAIKAGAGHLYIAGGAENMTRGPYVVSKPSTAFGTDSKMYDSSFGWRFINPRMHELYGTDAMGETAENLVDVHGISRDDQDAFALWSQQKAAKAQANGFFAEEIAAVSVAQRKGDPLIFLNDEFIKPNTTLEGLAKLKPAFRKNGTVTAGNASGLNDGAAAVIVASEQAVKQYQLEPMVRIVSSATAGVEPRIMGIGPVEASYKALNKAGLSLDDMDVIELNEAFAAQALACTRSWGLNDTDARINPNGGSIALGHPLGVSGTRIAWAAARELKRSGKRYALVTMCIGVGQGYAAVLERV
ncbi:MAG: 3-oxoadipyl-CoA thiolase [Bacteroidia bacterium]